MSLCLPLHTCICRGKVPYYVPLTWPLLLYKVLNWIKWGKKILVLHLCDMMRFFKYILSCLAIFIICQLILCHCGILSSLTCNWAGMNVIENTQHQDTEHSSLPTKEYSGVIKIVHYMGGSLSCILGHRPVKLVELWRPNSFSCCL